MIEITEQPLDAEAITAKVKRDTSGAVVTFLGITRRFSEGRTVLYLEYEAYNDMALKKLSQIHQEILQERAIEEVAIAHRIGRLEIEETSLVVAVASPHRKEAFLACHKVVDRIKEIVPIWKKEIFEDGSAWVESNYPETSPFH